MQKAISKFISQLLVFTALMAAPSMWAGTVEAQDGPPSETTYDFEDDLVTGDLIQIREHFIPEMLKSVEDL
jgi:hypothetical protein